MSKQWNKDTDNDHGKIGRLKGRTIVGIWVSPGEHQMRFSTDTGDVGIKAEGDCCSESWFADLTGVDALLGGRVRDVEPIDMPDDGQERTRQDYDLVYGYRITTDRGFATLAFRNSSNGYYGGSLEDSAAAEATRPITEDWSA